MPFMFKWLYFTIFASLFSRFGVQSLIAFSIPLLFIHMKMFSALLSSINVVFRFKFSVQLHERTITTTISATRPTNQQLTLFLLSPNSFHFPCSTEKPQYMVKHNENVTIIIQTDSDFWL